MTQAGYRSSGWFLTVMHLLFFLALPHSAWAQSSRLADPATWQAVEVEMLDEVNLLRRDPPGYAEQVLVPLKGTLRRRPRDAEQPYESSRVQLSDDRIDYIDIPEGESTEDALAVIDEAIDALRATPALAELTRNEPLDRAARWFSDDFQRATDERAPHVDSLGRLPAARISSFGATARALAQWNRFVARANDERRLTLHTFQEGEDYFLVDLPARGGFRYRYVEPAFGKFVAERGGETTIPRLEKAGHALEVTVDVVTRRLHSGDASIEYPWPMPLHGENVVWGPWSRQCAARGLVCWWILDPGVPDRGHRHTLLEPTIRYCGIGCTWSRRKGFVATLDVTTEKMLPLP